MNLDKRQVRVKELLGKLKSGQEITLRDFKSVLGKDEYAEYETMWANEKDKRDVVKPKKILLYETKLREVKLSHARYEKHRINYGSNDKSLILEQNTEHLIERLVEFWNDLISSDVSLLIWFDRSVIKNLSIEELPHIVNSKSSYKQSDGLLTKRTKKEIKIEILETLLNPVKDSKDEQVEFSIKKKKLTKQDFKDFKI